MKMSKKTIKRVRGICLLVLGLSAMFVVWGYDPIAVKILKSATVFFLLSLCVEVDVKYKKKKKKKETTEEKDENVVRIDFDNVQTKTWEQRVEEAQENTKHVKLENKN